MNPRVETAALPQPEEATPISLPAGAGVALAVLVGSVLWMFIFALIM